MEYVPYTMSQLVKEAATHRNRKVNLDSSIRYMRGMLEGLAYLEVTVRVNGRIKVCAIET